MSIYLNAKVITKVNDEIEIIVCRIPSKEKMSNEPVFSESFSIRAEKDIFCLNFSLPILQIAVDISLVVSSIP